MREDVRVSRKEPFEKHAEIVQKIQNAKDTLSEKGRVFVRYSGTEPLARVMVEGEDFQLITDLSKDIASSIQRILG